MMHPSWSPEWQEHERNQWRHGLAAQIALQYLPGVIECLAGTGATATQLVKVAFDAGYEHVDAVIAEMEHRQQDGTSA